jgi:hypothetical protein
MVKHEFTAIIIRQIEQELHVSGEELLTRQYIFRHLRHKLSPDQENIV